MTAPTVIATATPLNPQILGQAENAHRALLERILGTHGGTYHQWVALTLTANGGDTVERAPLLGRIAGALKVDAETASRALSDLVAEGLVAETPDGASVAATEAGRARFGAVRAAIGEKLGRAYAVATAEELAVAGRVLAAVTERIDAELAG
ncbi:MarR family winged helix-turn-helix transcriptional regulator [Yinghuangia seranimata]|uniref:MarR family winged helix-turn-helix transcriptional regulator n=1 Tax=Yinghuangia seranimata TaxID=408067 RepID=UPI00248BB980|nr:MarR family winged helix-turn-helix transcriptional regulator [Yinghuangia seranimata]MDI2125564.1 MarR family winged helix-turn-helix transcriptional regulator [Yinghuangia seranimata]